MDIYYILDLNNTLIDKDKDYKKMKVLSDILNSNSYNGNRYRVLETKAEGKLCEGVNLVTYIYYNGVPKRIFINQLRTVSDYVQELYKNEDYGNYEIRSEWIVK